MPAPQDGSAEHSLSATMRECDAHPEWFNLKDQAFVLIGATSEMGPLEPLLAAGATVVAIARKDNPKRASKWTKLLEKAKNSPGTLICPLSAADSSPASAEMISTMAPLAGADATADLPGLIQWLLSSDMKKALGGKPVSIYNGIYLDGEGFVRASVAMEAVVAAYLQQGLKPTLLYIDTPSHAHVVPADVKKASEAHRLKSSTFYKVLATVGVLKDAAFHQGVLEKKAESCRCILDGLAVEQGPNYAVAKFLQRFRALVARDSGCIVSATNGPAAKTDSVMHAKTMAICMENMELFPPNVAHEPETVQALMTMVMIRDIMSETAYSHPSVTMDHPMDLFYENAWHGGMWQSPYGLKSVGTYVVVRHYLLRFVFPVIAAAGAYMAFSIGN